MSRFPSTIVVKNALSNQTTTFCEFLGALHSIEGALNHKKVGLWFQDWHANQQYCTIGRSKARIIFLAAIPSESQHQYIINVLSYSYHCGLGPEPSTRSSNLWECCSTEVLHDASLVFPMGNLLCHLPPG